MEIGDMFKGVSFLVACVIVGEALAAGVKVSADNIVLKDGWGESRCRVTNNTSNKIEVELKTFGADGEMTGSEVAILRSKRSILPGQTESFNVYCCSDELLEGKYKIEVTDSLGGVRYVDLRCKQKKVDGVKSLDIVIDRNGLRRAQVNSRQQ